MVHKLISAELPCHDHSSGITLLLLVRATYMYGVVLHAHPVHDESHNEPNTTGEVATVTETSNTTPKSVSTSSWLCVTSNMKSSLHKTWQTSLLFLELLQIQNLERKRGGTSHIMPSSHEKLEGTRPRVPHQIASISMTKQRTNENDETMSVIKWTSLKELSWQDSLLESL